MCQVPACHLPPEFPGARCCVQGYRKGGVGGGGGGVSLNRDLKM